MSLEAFFLGLLQTLDITSGFNARLVLAFALVIMVGEAEIQAPLLVETVWLMLGYQARTGATAICNLTAAFALSQVGRCLGITAVYFLLGAIGSPIARPFTARLRRNRHYQKYIQGDYLEEARFLTATSATLGMMTPFNYPVKILLIVKRKLRVLLIGTLFSGMYFDLLYILGGAIFRTTNLNITFLPAMLATGALVFLLLRRKLLR